MSENITPAYREEKLLANIAGGDYDITPATRKEKLLAEIQGQLSEIEGLPDTTGASVGDVLTIGSDGPEWAAASGGIRLLDYEWSALDTSGADPDNGFYGTCTLTIHNFDVPGIYYGKIDAPLWDAPGYYYDPDNGPSLNAAFERLYSYFLSQPYLEDVQPAGLVSFWPIVEGEESISISGQMSGPDLIVDIDVNGQ